MKKTQNTNEEFSYDVVSYPGIILPNAHPDRLAAIAQLYRMNPASAEKCRVLELGCGDGANLNWLAYNLPKSEFVGIDLAQNHIVEAKKNAEDLQLQNVTFLQEDVLKITEAVLGKFDYIIAHGLFSWVPDIVRQKILSLYNELLNPNGVGFISYNAYPGCYRRQIVNDLMRYYTQKFENPQEKVEQGIAFIEFLTENVKSPVYHEILKYEFDSFGRRPAQNIYHDDLAEINQPFYFTEFISEAEKHNLKFLSESDYLFSHRTFLSQELTHTIENISQTVIEQEQYADFFESRRFRQTLVCKKDVETKETINLSDLNELYVSSSLKPKSPTIDLSADSLKEFVSKKGEAVKIGHVLTKIVLMQLVNAGSHPIKFTDLINSSNEILKSQGVSYEDDDLDKEIEITATILLQLYSPNAIGFHTMKSKALDYISEKPLVSKFTRWQSAKTDLVANFYGVGLNIHDDFICTLLDLLDGTRTRGDLLSELTAFVHSSKEITDKETFLENMAENLDRNLFVLAKMGFFVA